MDEATKLLHELVEANDEWAAPATTLEAHEHAQLKYELAQEAARAYLSRAPAEAPPREIHGLYLCHHGWTNEPCRTCNPLPAIAEGKPHDDRV